MDKIISSSIMTNSKNSSHQKIKVKKMNYIRKRINLIRELNKDRNFAPAVLLGGKAIIILSFFMAMQTITLVQPLENSVDKILAKNSFLLFSAYVGIFVLLAGKEIIQLHLIAFSRLDSIIRKAIDAYSIKYWRKNKKDSKFLSKFASLQYKLFKPMAKMNPKKRNAMLFGIIMTYLIIDYMRFGLLQILGIHLNELLTSTYGGIKIGS